MKKSILFLFVFSLCLRTVAENGYDLWMGYRKVENSRVLTQYKLTFTSLLKAGQSPTLDAAMEELQRGLKGTLDRNTAVVYGILSGTLVFGNEKEIKKYFTLKMDVPENKEGFVIRTVRQGGVPFTIITSKSDIGVLYGAFHLLRMLQSQADVSNLRVTSAPKLQLRLLNHWDNLNRSVERGYAGISIWNWHTLPDYKDPRYKDYARANASLGINGVSVTNVNANAMALTKPYLEKFAALANIFRPYGIRLYLTARFSAPMELDRFKTADPLNEEVRNWWKKKTEEIYSYIPDFGGFLVKANSEGQPGPQNYKRSHADGANMLAEAVAPHGGNVIWRAFVYNPESKDRFKQAYEEFMPLDGQFNSNVLVQVKNGPIDFQPREPFSPLFGAMKKTPLMMEFQITQEYLGQATHLVYEAPLFKEVLKADTYAKGKGSTVASVIEGKVHGNALSGISGVANIGNDMNWTGHLFGQANWYAFGRLAWDHALSSESIAEEWIKQTFGRDSGTVNTIRKMMLSSHETLVNYMTPLGLHHIMGNGHHYGPAPWSNNLPRPDWNPVYYHRADSIGIGFDRTVTGSNALSQYAQDVAQSFADPNLCDESYLLWFHHVSWSKKMSSGRTLWEELCHRYYTGVDEMKKMKAMWSRLKDKIDPQRFDHVSMLLDIQLKEAIWWRNACLLYFQTFSNMPIPAHYEQPDKKLEHYKSLRFPFAPGNG